MEILIRNEQDKLSIDEDRVKEVVNFILKRELKTKDKSEISIFITDDETIAYYNEKYRSIEGPTDVLSFSYNDEDELVGDIIISAETVIRNASEYRVSPLREFYFVLIHALLHLCGYTHDKAAERDEMFKKQESYLNAFWKGDVNVEANE